MSTDIQLTKRNKEYIDISLSSFGAPNPLNGDLTTIRNEVAINNAIKNIVMFFPSEVPFNRDIGSNTVSYLFELVDEVTAGLLAEEIRRAIEFCEPRVTFVPFDEKLLNSYDAQGYKQQSIDFTYGAPFISEQMQLGVFVNANPEQNQFEVTIIYRIIGGQEIFRVQQLLTPTR